MEKSNKINLIGGNDNDDDKEDTLMTRSPEDGWHQKQNACEIAYTYVNKEWTWGEKKAMFYHYSPWGMEEGVSRRLNVISSYNVCPTVLHDELGITKEIFGCDRSVVVAKNTGW